MAGLKAFLRQLSLFDAPAPPLPAGPAPSDVSIPASDGRVPEPARPHASHRTPPGFEGFLCGPYACIEVEVKPRLRESWRVTWTGRNGGLRLSIPPALAEAPAETKRALLDWCLLVARRRRTDPQRRALRRHLEEGIRAALDGDAGRRNPSRSARDRRRLDRLDPRGEHHDLQAVFDAINARYFDGALEARITWSSRLGGLSTHTIARDGEGRPYHLLTISRGYDSAEASFDIVGGVVYHECLHIAIPPRTEGGRRIVHGADFRRREREYHLFEEWRRWHREELPRRLRALRRRARKGS